MSEARAAAFSRPFALFAAFVLLVACLFALAACDTSEDAANLKGEWQVQGTDTTVVFTGSEFKTSAGTMTYTLNTEDKTITFSADGATGTSTYKFTKNYKKLTLKEDDGKGGTDTTVFVKVSSDVNAAPSDWKSSSKSKKSSGKSSKKSSE